MKLMKTIWIVMLIFQLIAIYFKLTAIEFKSISWIVIFYETETFITWIILNSILFKSYKDFKDFADYAFKKKK